MNQRQQLVKGQKIRLVLTEGDEYTGIIHHIGEGGSRIALYNVEDVSTGEIYQYVHYYSKNEIRELEIIEDKVKKTVTNPKPAKVPVESSTFNKLTDDELPPLIQKQIVRLKLLKDQLQHLKWVQSEALLIRSLNKQFNEAIKSLELSETIALDGKIVNNCVSLLIVANWDYIFIFDIKTMGKEAFKNGLETILQSDITKVVYAGVEMINCLRNQYGVTVGSVIDLQIMDVMIRHTFSKEKPLIALRKLSESLQEYLNAPEQFVDDNLDGTEWDRRPIDACQYEKLTQYVLYLIALKNAMSIILNQNFYHCVDRFMDSLCGMDPGEVYYMLNRPEKVLEMMEKLTFSDDSKDRETSETN